MRVNDGMNVGSHSINQLMHRELGRDAIGRGFKRIAVITDDDHHFRLHPPFAHGGWCSNDSIGANADTDVAVTSHNQPAIVTSARNVDDLLAYLSLVHCFHDGGVGCDLPLPEGSSERRKSRKSIGQRLCNRTREEVGETFERYREINVLYLDAWLRIEMSRSKIQHRLDASCGHLAEAPGRQPMRAAQ